MREPTQALAFTPADHLTSQHIPDHTVMGRKAPRKRTPSHSPRHEETQTLPRGAGRGQGRAPCQGSVPATTAILSWDEADPHHLPWAPHTDEEGQQPQQGGHADPHAPQNSPQGGGTDPLTSFLHTWLEKGGDGHTAPVRDGVCATGPLPAEGYPRPSHPSERGDRPPSAEGSPRLSHSSVWGERILSHPHMAERGGSHTVPLLCGVCDRIPLS